jgi:hypothetical protein
MKLKNLIKQLQQMIDAQPKLAEYAVLHRGEGGRQETTTHAHTEGRTLILSSTWAEDILNPVYGDKKEAAKLRGKVKKLKSDEEMALEDVTGKPVDYEKLAEEKKKKEEAWRAKAEKLAAEADKE